MMNALAQALMQPNDAQVAEMQQRQYGPMGGMFGAYGQYQPFRTALHQALQNRTPSFDPGASANAAAATPQLY